MSGAHAGEHGGGEQAVANVAAGGDRGPACDRLADPRDDAIAGVGADERADVGRLVERVAEDEPLDARDERGEEAVVDRALGDHALHRDAGLPGVREPGAGDPLGGTVDVGVGRHDHRGGVAELEGDALARVARGELPADRGAPGERDHRDVGVVGEGGADRAAGSVQHRQGPRLEPRLQQDLGEREGRQRCRLGGLQHHRASRGDGGASLCATRFSGKLNGAIARDDADRLGEGERELAGSRVGSLQRHDLPRESPRLNGGEGEGIGAASRLDPRLGDRLAGFDGDDRGQPVGLLRDPRRGAFEHRGAFGGRRWGKVPAGGSDRAADVGLARHGDPRDDVAGVRAHDLEVVVAVLPAVAEEDPRRVLERAGHRLQPTPPGVGGRPRPSGVSRVT